MFYEPFPTSYTTVCVFEVSTEFLFCFFFLFDVVTLQMCGRTKLHVEMLCIESLLVYLTLAHESSKTLRPPSITHHWGHLFASGIYNAQIPWSFFVLGVAPPLFWLRVKLLSKNCLGKKKNDFCCAPAAPRLIPPQSWLFSHKTMVKLSTEVIEMSFAIFVATTKASVSWRYLRHETSMVRPVTTEQNGEIWHSFFMTFV